MGEGLAAAVEEDGGAWLISLEKGIRAQAAQDECGHCMRVEKRHTIRLYGGMKITITRKRSLNGSQISAREKKNKTERRAVSDQCQNFDDLNPRTGVTR